MKLTEATYLLLGRRVQITIEGRLAQRELAGMLLIADDGSRWNIDILPQSSTVKVIDNPQQTLTNSSPHIHEAAQVIVQVIQGWTPEHRDRFRQFWDIDLDQLTKLLSII